MSKLEIFENGYLKSEFINPNYRGTKGWPYDRGYDKYLLLSVADDCIVEYSLTDKVSDFTSIKNSVGEDGLRIKQFTPSDIPLDEIVFVRHDYRNEDEPCFVKTFMCDTFRKNAELYTIVPFLIAGTEEEAERLADWAN